jgi:hypothetical protein
MLRKEVITPADLNQPERPRPLERSEGASMQSPLYYRHSGKVGPLAIPYMLGFGLAGSFVLGFLYAYAVYHIPIVYLNILLVVFYGMAIGFLVGYGARRGQSRNRLVSLLSGFLLGLVALYVAWVFWIRAVTSGELMPFSPAALLSILQVINERGVWSVGSGKPVTGISLYIVWGAEALTVVIASTVVAYRTASEEPFCEKCMRWIDKKQVISPLQVIASPESFRSRLELADYGELVSLKPALQGDAAFTKLELIHCQSCRQYFFLTVREGMVEVDSKGNLSTRETTLFELLSIQPAIHDTLIQQWGARGPQ